MHVGATRPVVKDEELEVSEFTKPEYDGVIVGIAAP